MSMSCAVPVGASNGAGPGHVPRSMGAGLARADPSYERRQEEILAVHRPDGIHRPHHGPGQGARLRLEYVRPEGNR